MSDIIDLGNAESKYAEIAEALVGKDPREKSDLNLREINAISYLTVLAEKWQFKHIEALISHFLRYRMSLKRQSRSEVVDVFRSLMREREFFSKENEEEAMMK